MRITTLITLLLAGALCGITGCALQQKAIVAEVANEKISLQEFETMFAKNNGGWTGAAKTPIEEREKFLDLYVKYKMKVKEAYARGYDKDPELRNELNDYRKNLAVTYVIDKEVTGPALQEMYSHRSQEIRASHILIELKEGATPADTLEAYTKAIKIIDSLKLGYPFADMAIRNSQDPSAASNKGDLYYFSGGAMVPEFESAVFNINVGQVSSQPIRTQFGYHIIKVTDRRQNPGQVNPAHIMKRLSKTSTADDSAKAWKDMNIVLDSLKAGADFADLARRFSDDTYSGPQGGDLGLIERRRTVKEFDSVAFALRVGQFSNVVTTPFGLHIIKLIKAVPVKSFNEMEQELKTDYQRTRYQADYNRLVAQMKKQYNYSEDENVLLAFAAAADTTKTTNDVKWDSTIAAPIRAKSLLTINGAGISIDSVIALQKVNPDLQNLSMRDAKNSIRTIVDKIGSNLVVEYRARLMEDQFPRFKSTMKEYEEGILLFKTEQEEVWNKVTAKDSILRIYHKENASKYEWPDRVNVQEIFVPTDSVAAIVKKALAGSIRDSVVEKSKRSKKLTTITITVPPISFDSAAVVYNQREATKAQKGVYGLLPVTQNELTEKAWKTSEGAVSEPFPFESGVVIVKTLKKDPKRLKTFEEAMSEVSGQFQDFETKRLENVWQSYLMNKYPVVLHNDVLKMSFAPENQPAPAKDDLQE